MPHDCPSEDRLLAFHQGTLPDDQLDAVAEHLECCPKCEAKVEQFDTNVDPLLALLRRPVPAASTTIRGAAHWRLGAPRPQFEPAEAAPEFIAWPALPGYEMLSVLGVGGMGVVFKARQLSLKRLVAVKRLRTGSPEALARSRIEAEAPSHWRHPHIVQIYEIIEHDGQLYLAMELVEGGALSAKLAGKPQAAAESARLIEVVSRAVHFAHTNGIVHRDLKPSNILLSSVATAGAANEQAADTTVFGSPKITDFGIAKRLASDAGATQDGDVLGTASYMAPEQASGDSDRIGPATDVYSLGVVLYEMLTGHVPLLGPNTLETLILVRNEEPVPPRQLQHWVPRDLETICLKCREKEPRNRYATAEALADDLWRFLEGKPIHARRTPVWERAWKWVRRHPSVTALSAAVVLVAALGVGSVGWQWRRAEDTAEREIKARKSAESSGRQVERLSASVMLNQAATLCEAGDVRRGLLWMVRALETAVRVGDADLERVARYNIAGWQPFLLREQTRARGSEATRAIGFTPDGRTTLVAGGNAVSRLDSATGEPAGAPLGHDGAVWAVAVSSDGRWILTGSSVNDGERGEARLWSSATGELHVPPLAHEGPVTSVAFGPDGETFLTVCPSEARMWRTADGQPACGPMRHEAPDSGTSSVRQPMVAVLSRDGRLVGTGGADHTARVWNAATGEPLREPFATTSPVSSLAFSPDGNILLTGNADGGVRMWDVTTGGRRWESLRLRGRVNVVAFSPDGQLVAAAGAVGYDDREPAGEVQLCQVATGQALGAALPFPKPVRSLAFSPQGRLLLTGCDDGQARFFLTATAASVGKPLAHPGPVGAVGFNHDGSAAVTASGGTSRESLVRLWSVPGEEAFGQTLVQAGELRSAVFGPDCSSVATGTRDGNPQLWDLHTCRSLELPGAQAGAAEVFAYSHGGTLLLTGGDGNVRLWDRAALEAREPIVLGARLGAAAFTPDDRRLLLGDERGGVRIVESETGRVLAELSPRQGPIRSVAVRNDGRMLLAAGDEGAWIWDGDTHELLYWQSWPSQDGLVAASFGPDDRHVLLLVDGSAYVWDVGAGTLGDALEWQAEGDVGQVAFHPDGRSLLVVGSDNVVRLRDWATGKSLGPPVGREVTRAVAFCPEGRRLAAGGTDGKLAVWDVWQPIAGDPNQVRLRIELLTGMEFTSQETIRELRPEALNERQRQLDALTD